MKYEVIVELKEEVLDTQGRAIQQALQRIGKAELQSVKVSKRFVMEVGGDEESGIALVREIAEQHLANPVSETFSCRKL